MASSATSYLLFSAVLAACMAEALVAGFQYEVGGGRGWRLPTGKEAETYDEWAESNRFHIGDTLHFKYHRDSVLVVGAADYLSCNTSDPISRYEDGSSVFRFDRPGLFYFISGGPGHCKYGQKLVVRVMHPSQLAAAPQPAMSPVGVGGGWDVGPTASSASGLGSVAFGLAASALLGVSVSAVLY